jgi:hypothetical protein
MILTIKMISHLFTFVMNVTSKFFKKPEINPPAYYHHLVEKYFNIKLNEKSPNDIDTFLCNNNNINFIEYAKILQKIDNYYIKLIKYGEIKIKYNINHSYDGDIKFTKNLKKYINDTYDNENRRINVYSCHNCVYVEIMK